MSTECDPSSDYEHFLAEGRQALLEGHYSRAIFSLGEAILSREIMIPAGRPRTFRMTRYFDRRVAAVTQVAEIAMPRGMAGIHLQRVRVERLRVGRKERPGLVERFRADGKGHQGLNINLRYALGGSVETTIVRKNGSGDLSWQMNSRTDDIEAGFTKVCSTQNVATMMNWAADEGTVLPHERHGKRTVRDRLEATNISLVSRFVDMLSPGK